MYWIHQQLTLTPDPQGHSEPMEVDTMETEQEEEQDAPHAESKASACEYM